MIKRIGICCTGNTCRSPIMGIWLEEILQMKAVAISVDDAVASVLRTIFYDHYLEILERLIQETREEFIQLFRSVVNRYDDRVARMRFNRLALLD